MDLFHGDANANKFTSSSCSEPILTRTTSHLQGATNKRKQVDNDDDSKKHFIGQTNGSAVAVVVDPSNGNIHNIYNNEFHQLK